jgi:hypothetical protein
MAAKCKHFVIQELVPPEIYKELGENAWSLISDKWAVILDTLREHFDKPIIINNWHKGGTYKYRGLRPKGCGVGKETSQHYIKPLTASDFDVVGLSDKEVKVEILKNGKKFFDLGVRRMESDADAPTWCHLDCKETGKSVIHVFRA